MLLNYKEFILQEGIWYNVETNCRLERIGLSTYKHTNFNTNKIVIGNLDIIKEEVKIKVYG